MQLDMHYYGTYAMARSAGLKKDAARIIATAAQFVDDNAEKESINFRDGGRLDAEATAHHAFDRKNIDLEDQRRIWVPFHFLPGNEGASFTERLVCRMHSRVTEEMVAFNLSMSDRPYALPLVGITAHVFADTFSHYGFSGISSRRNKVVNDSFRLHGLEPEMEKYVTAKAEKFREDYAKEAGLLDNVKSWFAEGLSGALGHGAALTFPDRPYLVWQFEYEEPPAASPLRENPQTFLEACRGLHAIFRRFALARPDLAENDCADFADIEGTVGGILKLQAPKSGRIQAWRKAARDGRLFPAGAEAIPGYNAFQWLNERDNLRRSRQSDAAAGLSVFRFFQAAAVHRIHVLRNLLPSHGLVVS